MRKLTIVTILVIMLAAAAAAASAECVKHADGKTALVFDNASIYSVTFYVDDAEIVRLPAHTISGEFAVVPGPHVLAAVAPGMIGDLWVFAKNDIPEGYVCTWHVAEYGIGNEVKSL